MHAPRRPPRVIARGARAGVIGDAALEDEDLLVSHEDGTPLEPRTLRRRDVEAGRRRHGTSTSTMPFTTRVAKTPIERSSATRHWPVARPRSKPGHGPTTASPSTQPTATGPSS